MTDFGRVIRLHKTTHQTGGNDEISVASLSGLLAASQTALAHALGGSKHTVATLAALNALISDATLDTSSASRTPDAHKASHQDGGSDEISCALLAGRINYVDRGDPASADFTRPNLDTDGAVHDMDLSSIVPAGAIAVHLRFTIMGTSVGLYFRFFEKGNSNTVNRLNQLTQVANVTIECDGFIMLDANRVISYITSNDAFGNYNVVVRGWLI